MARVTVEDCLEQVENRFSLVHAAVQRAKSLHQGATPLVTCDNRQIVTALREIADQKVQADLAPLEDMTKKKKKKRSKS